MNGSFRKKHDLGAKPLSPNEPFGSTANMILPPDRLQRTIGG
ncbi:MAG TPA: hypothetical protein VJR87_05210 [Allosphingosinicella sp.]|nr:hypothetical protein [Allosphingosinicella sp.]